MTNELITNTTLKYDAYKKIRSVWTSGTQIYKVKLNPPNHESAGFSWHLQDLSNKQCISGVYLLTVEFVFCSIFHTGLAPCTPHKWAECSKLTFLLTLFNTKRLIRLAEMTKTCSRYPALGPTLERVELWKCKFCILKSASEN